jgi:hypothetical protein
VETPARSCVEAADVALLPEEFVGAAKVDPRISSLRSPSASRSSAYARTSTTSACALPFVASTRSRRSVTPSRSTSCTRRRTRLSATLATDRQAPAIRASSS